MGFIPSICPEGTRMIPRGYETLRNDCLCIERRNKIGLALQCLEPRGFGWESEESLWLGSVTWLCDQEVVTLTSCRHGLWIQTRMFPAQLTFLKQRHLINSDTLCAHWGERKNKINEGRVRERGWQTTKAVFLETILCRVGQNGRLCSFRRAFPRRQEVRTL